VKALLSVYDKTGLVEFARSVSDLGYALVSTGGTHQELSQAGVQVRQVADVTGSPEILGGRVKTLHPVIHGGILARRDMPDDLAQLAEHNIEIIDLVVSNLYPFRETITSPSVALEKALENIDIGGPAMIRAAAKNFPHVVIVVDPDDYDWVAGKLRSESLSQEERQRLARKAFQHVALYDTAVAEYLQGDDGPFSQELTLGMTRVEMLRYGENPHQKGAFYALDSMRSPVEGMGAYTQCHGKEMSFVNILDADAAYNLVADFAGPALAIIKHTNPCCFATGQNDVTTLYQRALTQGDAVSAYGGIVASNRPIDMAYARALREVLSPVTGGRMFFEIVIAPGAEPEALEHLKKKSTGLRILTASLGEPSRPRLDFRAVRGGVVVHDADVSEETEFKVVTKRKPSDKIMADLRVAWTVCKHVKSNAITLVKDGVLVGMGAGQPNRVTSVKLAALGAGERSKGSVLASDALFPFADNVEEAASAGVTAIVQPGGSIRDDESIQAADRLGIAMVFTGVRHFRH
jgi:phosphoribosylaminoimidazolecarboxamide formyltransferase/IMP cyclohydrolase